MMSTYSNFDTAFSSNSIYEFNPDDFGFEHILPNITTEKGDIDHEGNTIYPLALEIPDQPILKYPEFGEIAIGIGTPPMTIMAGAAATPAVSVSNITQTLFRISATFPVSGAWGNKLSISVTETSVTYTVKYPSTSAYGNRLCYYNKGWINMQPYYYMKDGSYTISNLNPSTQYQAEFWYWNAPQEA